MDITIEKVAGGLGDEAFFDHTTGIGEMQLKNVSPCLNVKPDRERIRKRVSVSVELIVIFRVQRQAFR